MIEKKKIAGVIVTFNRKKLLLNNICNCLAQRRIPDKIIVIDNHSSDGSQDYINMNLDDSQKKRIDYVYLDENVGGAGGFSYGVKYAYEDQCDYIWLMDDDGYPVSEDTLLILEEFIIDKGIADRAFIVNSLVICDDEFLSFGVIDEGIVRYKISDIKKSVIYNFANPFNGTMISRELVDKIGYPRADYFIKGDEREYLLRAESNNIPIYTITNSKYYHPSPFDWSKRKGDNLSSCLKYVEPAWKEYYLTRNVCLNSKYYRKFYFARQIRYLLKRIFLIMQCGESKKDTIRKVIVGYYHCLIGKTGVYYLPDGSIRK